ncbi:MAG: FHA domain-containing protein [Betaproteobacteria bacterium]|nr:MAG: FHA domain-containing protein [Betaproteobacteria bacterium]
MAKLILSLDGQVIKEYDINKERMTIGRKPHNDIQIDNLAVSGEHAMIMTILNDSFLEDLGSTNGTMVNGQPVKKHFLQGDDVVEIGKYKLKYVNEKAGGMSQQEFEKTMVLKTPPVETAKAKAATDTNVSDTKPDMQANPQAAVVAQAAMKADAAAEQPAVGGKPQEDATNPLAGAAGDLGGTIQILSGPNAGRELPLSKPLTTLGKPGIQVAVIAKRPQGYFITHVEGTNFPVVNGKPLDAQAQKLQDHDIIELAGVKMEFFLKS